MKRVVLWVCTLLMTLMASVCVAGTYSPYFATEPPREVREHVASPLAGLRIRGLLRGARYVEGRLRLCASP